MSKKPSYKNEVILSLRYSIPTPTCLPVHSVAQSNRSPTPAHSALAVNLAGRRRVELTDSVRKKIFYEYHRELGRLKEEQLTRRRSSRA